MIESFFPLQPLKALGSYQLMLGVARQLADAHNCVSALCQSASILLDLGAPEPAMVLVVVRNKSPRFLV